MDTTGSLEVEFTSTAAECLLHKAPTEFKKLSEIERQMTLSYFVETEVMLCISKVHTTIIASYASVEICIASIRAIKIKLEQYSTLYKSKIYFLSVCQKKKKISSTCPFLLKLNLNLLLNGNRVMHDRLMATK